MTSWTAISAIVNLYGNDSYGNSFYGVSMTDWQLLVLSEPIT